MRSVDLRAALDFLERIGGAGDLDEFAQTLVHALGEVIPADVVAYNEVNPSLGRASFLADYDVEGDVPEARAILERHMHDNPLVVYTERTGDGSAHTWSEFVTQRWLHATELWNGLFRPFAIERQMVALLPAPPPLLVGVVLNRSGRDFSQRDRTLLNAVRPHLANAYRNSQARAVLAALEGTAREHGDAIVVLGALGDPLAVTPRARRLLGAFGESDDDRLPERMLAWCREARRRAPLPAEPLAARTRDGRIEARFLAPSVVALHATRERVQPFALQRLGLTPRECTVLALVAEGETNKGIALRIDVRPATVKKHLERIYAKLGVTTRTAAAAAAFRAGET